MWFTEKKDADFRSTVTNKYQVHELLTNKGKINKLTRRIKNVEAEIRNMQGMHKGRSVKRALSDPNDEEVASGKAPRTT